MSINSRLDIPLARPLPINNSLGDLDDASVKQTDPTPILSDAGSALGKQDEGQGKTIDPALSDPSLSLSEASASLQAEAEAGAEAMGPNSRVRASTVAAIPTVPTSHNGHGTIGEDGKDDGKPGVGSGTGTAASPRRPVGVIDNGRDRSISSPDPEAIRGASMDLNGRPRGILEEADELHADPTRASSNAGAGISMPELAHIGSSPGASASQVSLATSTTGGDSAVSPKRQVEFERIFRDQLALAGDRIGPEDLLVVATQTADLQAKILIHGRLYLTRSYLCFKANILGWKTEKIHRIKDMTVVEKSTTAKWIQNAVSITMEKPEPGSAAETDDEATQGKVFGYGSMADRDAMYEALAAFWKSERPERFEALVKRKRAESAARRQREKEDNLATIKEDGGALEEGGGDEGSSVSSDTSTLEGKQVKHTERQGEDFKELALDVTLPVEPEQLFNLIYGNEEFTMDFLQNVQKLTDVKVTPWQEGEQAKSRKLTYVMHMIGPSKSDCIGEEIIEIADPETSFEIRSSTQTPDVPSGKNFKIHTRTCLTHASSSGRPGTRLYCTTQCDWSASSILKSTITPATIKGQEEYHQQLLGAVKKWIKNHPDDFELKKDADEMMDASKEAGNGNDAHVDGFQSAAGQPGASTLGQQGEGQGQGMNVFDQVMQIPGNQVMMGIVIVCLASLVLNYYLLFRSGARGSAGGSKGVVVKQSLGDL